MREEIELVDSRTVATPIQTGASSVRRQTQYWWRVEINIEVSKFDLVAPSHLSPRFPMCDQ